MRIFFVIFFLVFTLAEDSDDEGEDVLCESAEFDIVFLMDASQSINDDDFPKETDFIHDIIVKLPIDPEYVRASIIMFSYDGYEKVKVSFTEGEERVRLYLLTDTEGPSCVDRDDMYRRRNIELPPPYIPETDLAGAIKLGFETLYFMGNDREVKKVMLLVTDGWTMNPDQDIVEVNRVKDKGGYVFGVGVGEVDTEHLKSLCTEPEHYFEEANFDDLGNVVLQLAILFPCDYEFPWILLVFALLFLLCCCCCWLLALLMLFLISCCCLIAFLLGLLPCLLGLLTALTTGEKEMLVGGGPPPVVGPPPGMVNIPPVVPPPPAGVVVPPPGVIPPKNPAEVEESMYYIAGMQTAVNWGNEGMNWDSMYRPGDMGMGDGFGADVGLPEYKKVQKEKKEEKKLLKENDDEFDADEVDPTERYSMSGIKPVKKKKFWDYCTIL